MSDVEVVDIIADWLDEVETSAGVEWPFPTDALAAHVVSVLAASGHTIVPTSEVNSLNAFRWKALQGLAAAAAAEEEKA